VNADAPAPLAQRPPAQPEIPAPFPADTPRVTEVAPAPPEPRFEDLELPVQSVIGLQLETSVTSETARVEDEVIARVTRDVRVGDRVAIPAGSKVHGEVTLVERGARVREHARLGVRFTSIVLGDGTRLPIDTEPIYREGESVRNENAAKIGGGAIGGAIIGGLLGGAKGAAIGGALGGGAGTAAVAAQGRNAATLPAGAPVTVRIERPVTVSVER
jgi:type IV secretory pathway VirB10-like protein